MAEPTPFSPPPADSLAQHARFVRGIALALLGDEHAADDVVQETWLAALRRPPGHAGNLRGWLGTVVRRLVSRRRREEARRSQRERVTARPEALPATDDAVARQNALRNVTDAVLSLPEPYRTTLLLRYYEGLDPSTIAHDTDTPLATVKSRLQRGLGKMRERLDESSDGDRRAWSLGLVTLLASRHVTESVTSGVSLGAGTGVSAMLVNAKAGVVVAALAVVCGLGWWSTRDGAGEEPTSVVHALPPINAAPAGDEALAAAPTDADRTAVPVDEVPDPDPEKAVHPSGSLDVHVVSERTGGAAVGREVRFLFRGAGPGERDRRCRTDEQGRIRFDEVPVGDVTITPDLGSAVVTEVRADEQTRVDVTLSLGFQVRGYVLDRKGAPVPGAGLWLSDSSHRSLGTIVAHSAADGSFVIDDVPRSRHLGAIARGHAPSHLHKLRYYQSEGQREDIELELRLNGPEGVLSGIVVGLDDEPVAGAWVRVQGHPPHRLNLARGRFANAVATFDVRTNAGGRFLLEGLPIGEALVTVRAARTAALERRVRLSSQLVTEEVFSLAAPASVAGKVTDGAGNPVAGARIYSPDLNEPWDPSAESDGDGTYLLEGFAPGLVPLRAAHQALGTTDSTVTVAAAETSTWSPVLRSERVITGRIVDHEENPLAGWYVYATGARWGQGTESDANGAFELLGCREGEAQVFVRETDLPDRPDARQLTLDADTDDVLIRIKREERLSSGIRGRLLDPDGNARRSSLTLWTPDFGMGTTFETDEEGRFDISHLRSGTYVPVFRMPGQARLTLEPVTLLPERTHDLGLCQIESAGRLVLDLAETWTPTHGTRIHGHVTPASEVADPTAVESFEFDFGNEPPPIPLAPGDYLLSIYGPRDLGAEIVPFSIHGTDDTRVTVSPRLGHSCHFEIQVPERENVSTGTQLSLFDLDGHLITWFLLTDRHPQPGFRHDLAVGTYVLEIAIPDEAPRRIEFEVREQEPFTQQEFVFPLR